MREYESETLTVLWDPDSCIHSEKCWRGLGAVFDPKARPWIDVSGATDEAIADQVAKCPSGALGIRMHENELVADTTEGKGTMSDQAHPTIQPTPDGPYEVLGEVTLLDDDGNEVRDFEKVYLCRCGHSKKKPYCDGSHKAANFKG